MNIKETTLQQPPTLNPLQREALCQELSREDLSIYAAVRLARKDVEVEYFDAAISRLRVDADKLRMHGSVLKDLTRISTPIEGKRVMTTKTEQAKATRFNWLLLAAWAVTSIVAATTGQMFGLVPAVAATVISTTIFHMAGKRLGMC